jgi:hypothetical protein
VGQIERFRKRMVARDPGDILKHYSDVDLAGQAAPSGAWLSLRRANL